MKGPLTRINLYIYSSDLERINRLFGKTVDRSKIIRTTLHNYLNTIEAKAQQTLAKPQINVDDLLEDE